VTVTTDNSGPNRLSTVFSICSTTSIFCLFLFNDQNAFTTTTTPGIRALLEKLIVTSAIQDILCPFFFLSSPQVHYQLGSCVWDWLITLKNYQVIKC